MSLKTRDDLTQLRLKCRDVVKAGGKRILVCAGSSCMSCGAEDVFDAFTKALGEKGVACSLEFELEGDRRAVGVRKSGCLGLCELGVLVRVDPVGYLYTCVKPEDCAEIVEKTIVGGEFIDRLAYSKGGLLCRCQDEIPFYSRQTHLTLKNCGHIDPASILEFISVGGYSSLEKALFEMAPDDIVQDISRSILRGRGGGGFPTGKKWEQVRRQKAEKKYIVCNGDEGDPGAFMDCSLMVGDPHLMLEGMIIAGRACGSDEGYIYVRAEYPLAVTRLRRAVEQAEELGILGKNILGSGFNFRININRGAGAFVCGEGSALTASIEGKRGMPRVKPPRTVEHGLFNMPTVLNNVETFATVPIIIGDGVDAFLKHGTAKSPGTKNFSLTGNIENTGLIEVPMGTTLRQIVYDIGGGMRGGATFKAVQIGGPSGACLTEEHLDLPLDFDSLTRIGAMIGSGGMVVTDDNACMVELARFFMNFTQNESCGKCIPCREGTRRMLEILERVVAGEGREGDVELLLELADTVTHTSLCGLGKSAANPVVSTIRSFRSEYDAHIRDKRCPAGACQKLKRYSIDPVACKGCSKCSRVCPVGAISGKIKLPFAIDGTKCVKCGACVAACPFKAVLAA
ncbi:MAG: NADH-quinone oxidoreductase subunit NuoF [Planctomycetota bacterium]|jgi:NADH-quinone oxidoreductase subunit F|nr:NADH-quinone oxidoreductase subunit NuoF [Planctomycetota bacterium]